MGIREDEKIAMEVESMIVALVSIPVAASILLAMEVECPIPSALMMM